MAQATVIGGGRHHVVNREQSTQAVKRGPRVVVACAVTQCGPWPAGQTLDRLDAAVSHRRDVETAAADNRTAVVGQGQRVVCMTVAITTTAEVW